MVQVITPLRYIALALSLCWVPSTWADQESEREVLARLAFEITALTHLIEEAQAQADPTVRIPFQYDLLRYELNTVVHGINEYMVSRRAIPKPIEPLKGDYR